MRYIIILIALVNSLGIYANTISIPDYLAQGIALQNTKIVAIDTLSSLLVDGDQGDVWVFSLFDQNPSLQRITNLPSYSNQIVHPITVAPYDNFFLFVGEQEGDIVLEIGSINSFREWESRHQAKISNPNTQGKIQIHHTMSMGRIWFLVTIGNSYYRFHFDIQDQQIMSLTIGQFPSSILDLTHFQVLSQDSQEHLWGWFRLESGKSYLKIWAPTQDSEVSYESDLVRPLELTVSNTSLGKYQFNVLGANEDSTLQYSELVWNGFFWETPVRIIQSFPIKVKEIRKVDVNQWLVLDAQQTAWLWDLSIQKKWELMSQVLVMPFVNKNPEGLVMYFAKQTTSMGNLEVLKTSLVDPAHLSHTLVATLNFGNSQIISLEGATWTIWRFLALDPIGSDHRVAEIKLLNSKLDVQQKFLQDASFQSIVSDVSNESLLLTPISHLNSKLKALIFDSLMRPWVLERESHQLILMSEDQ